MSTASPVTSIQSERAALENCENEVIRHVNSIQPYGYLIAFEPSSGVVTHASENTSVWFNKPVNTILDANIHELLPGRICHDCNNAAAHSTISDQREHVGRAENINGKECDVFVHKKDNYLILELQPVTGASLLGVKTLDNVQRLLERLSRTQTLDRLLSSSVSELRALTGFDRVKAYKFLSDGAGEVVAESKNPDVDSFLGLRFPAFDIPKAARKLYATTPIRIIPSVSAEQVPILASQKHNVSLDLSLAIFRGLVPVHVMYLQNMGVKATMSLPIIVNNKMWGLFACHHMQEQMPSSEILTSAEIIGGSVSMMLSSILQRHRLARIERCNAVASKLFVPNESSLGFSSYWESVSAELTTLIDCDGVGLLSNGRYDTYGVCPSVASSRMLVEKLEIDYADSIDSPTPIALDSISTKYPDIDCGVTAGVLAIPKPAVSYQFLLFFRNSASSSLRWAGAPTKDVHKDLTGYRLNPRASFKEYVDSAQKRSDSFSDEDLLVAESLRISLTYLMGRVSNHRQQRERLGLMVRELNHRVRNILALVSSIISQTRKNTHDIESFVQSLEHRIQALSETHKLLSESDWAPIQVHTLFERALQLYRERMQSRIKLSGVDISLPPEIASLVALVVNELASNAVKYGALSNSDGVVELQWQTNSDDFILTWTERQGPFVNPPVRQGFGTSLIKEALTYEFDAKCELDFAQDGVVVQFKIPIEKFNQKNDPQEILDEKAVKIDKAFSALLLEDDYVISKDIVQMLKNLGASHVDAAPTLDRAAEYLNKSHYDFALIDANIRGEFSIQIAQQLTELGVPYAFATGYGGDDQQFRATTCLDVLTKPFVENALLLVLEKAGLR